MINPNQQQEVDAKSSNMLGDFKYYNLHHQAESVRWRFDDIHWDEIDDSKVSDDVLMHVRNIANVECTTYPGAMNFFREFSDDMDFTQWVTTWLYEETRHPHILMRWLSHFSEYIPEVDMSTRREIYPKGSTRIGTLCMNIISEMRAAALYVNVANSINEPVLQDICYKLSADEARHAAGFITYANKYINNSEERNIECLRALEMLYVWLNSDTKSRHPAGHFFADSDNQDGISKVTVRFYNQNEIDNRVCRAFGRLTEVPLENKSDIKKYIRYFYQKSSACA